MKGNHDMNTWGIGAIRDGGLWVRSLCAIIIVTFGGLVTSPAVAATRAEIERQERTAPPERDESTKLNTVLLKTRDQLRALAGKPDVLNRVATKEERKAARDALKALRAELRELDKAAREDFRSIEKTLRAKNLPDVILERHAQAVARYETEAAALLDSLALIETTDDGKAAEQAAKAFERLEKQQLERSHKPFDPDKMPFGTPDNKVRAPAMTAEEFSALGITPQPKILAATAATASGVGFGVDDPANPVYLAATPDAQITPAIQQLAEELEYNPVKIYNWVHNNIEYLPTYGSIQGSQLTLDNRKGNAFDTASLTIALLRASGIPARYVYGTVEIPTDQVMNWVGGVTDPMAAGNLMGQGGIPNTLIVNGGQVSHLRMEHIWVEVWVDFHPSRGAINSEGDSWMPMDASFKQYEYLALPDFDGVIDLDEVAIESELRETLEVGETLGYIRNVNEAVLQNVISDIQTQIENHAINNDINLNPATYDRKIQQQSYPILAGSLPMRMLAKAGSYAEIPLNKRLAGALIMNGETAFSRPFSEILSAEINLDYIPATDEDAALILEYGDRFNVPAYLLNLKPRVRIDGEVIWTGRAVPFGEARFVELQIREPGQDPTRIENKVYSGGSYAIAFNGPALGEEFSEVLIQRALQIFPYQGDDDTYYQERFPKQLHLSLMAYFWQVDMMSQTLALSDNAVRYGMPSVGMFNTSLEIFTYFGVPKDIRVSGVTIDVDQYYGSAVDKNNNADALITLNESIGSMASGYEHAIMQQLYDDEGISSIRALQVANERGLKLFRITSQNLSAALPLLDVSSAVQADVQNAVYAGKTVTIPESEMQINAWHGIGYIVSDSETGGAAYLISGGLNGGGTTEEKSGSEWFVSLVDATMCVINGAVATATILLTALKAPKNASRLFARLLGAAAAAIMFKIAIALILLIIIVAAIACIIDAYGNRRTKNRGGVYA